MIAPRIPHNEQERLSELISYDILDSLPESAYDDIVKIAAQICNTPIALISLIDRDRQWFKSKIGIEGEETDRETAFCAHAINYPEDIMEVENANLDERFHDNPNTIGEPFVTFYAGAPLVTTSGNALGTICVIDHKAKKLDDAQRDALKALSRQVMALLELKRKTKEIIEAQDILSQERKKFDDRIARYQKGLISLNEISSNKNLDLDGQLNAALQIACEYFGLSVGIISKIQGNHYAVQHQYINNAGFDMDSDKGYKLDETYCHLTFHAFDGVNAVHNVIDSPYVKMPCFEHLQLGAYIGSAYTVHGVKYGTVSFLSFKAHEPFKSYEVKFMELVAQIVGYLVERRESEKLIAWRKFVLEAFIATAPRAIAMFDKSLNYLASSGKWKASYGFEDEELEGKHHFDLIPDDRSRWAEIFEKSLQGEYQKCDEQLAPDGKWIRWECRPWHTESDVVGGIIMFIEDISEQKHQSIELQVARDMAEAASRAKETFLSNMSHEIRTPLNSIIGFTHLLLMDTPRPDQEESLKMLKFSGENLMVIINDILDFGKISSGKVQFTYLDFNLLELAGSIVQSMKFKYDEKNVALNLHYDNLLPKVFVGDAVRLSQVLTNLVGNAFKFTDTGQVDLIIAHAGTIDKSVNVRVKIKDTGIGIKKEKLETIFQEFEQESADTTRKYGGTGLGLAITKKLLQLMGSDINVKSEVGVGSEFSFELVLPVGNEHNMKVGLDADFQGTLRKPSNNLRLLVAEDNQVNQLVISKFLAKWGIALDFARNGVEAVEAARKKRYSLILMDLQMPELDGYKATQIIRKMPETYYNVVPIIALTASAMLDVKDKVYASGMNDYISKPFSPQELYKKIMSYAIPLPDMNLEESRFFRIINSLSDGDSEFSLTLAGLYIENFREFQEKAKEAIDFRDSHGFSQHLHKTKTTLLTLELSGIVEKLKIIGESIIQMDAGERSLAKSWIDDCFNGLVDEMNSDFPQGN